MTEKQHNAFPQGRRQNYEKKAETLRLREEAQAAIELEVSLANFLAAGLPDEVAARRRAYEEAMAEDIRREELES